ncbi:MAG TPA: hypothetical protein VGP82_25110, partial [Ktedonobacterales bacterium]|jgi:hypothetical protein|nr:hypothetical protein [Ktedonobacterales bacterium]
MLPRRKGSGTDVVHWKAITSFDTSRNWGVLADGGTPCQVTYAVASPQNTMQSDRDHCKRALYPRVH